MLFVHIRSRVNRSDKGRCDLAEVAAKRQPLGADAASAAAGRAFVLKIVHRYSGFWQKLQSHRYPQPAFSCEQPGGNW
ncbi:hypothetical protein [Burkholderia gladioli]|uniref:hypothetical protein n=1 Tax=Burkholderia gladioli TaxID=28095 RepID=UPI001ABBDF46|nr:hypothetical protein [Burkholderia gladioli]